MNYERERILAETKAKELIEKEQWRDGAQYLFLAARATFNMAKSANGNTRDRLIQRLLQYEKRGDQAMSLYKVTKQNGSQKKIQTNDDQSPNETAKSMRLVERPDTRLDDVAGMEELKEIIQTSVILPMKYPDIYAEYRQYPGTGVLMYGPPGTGKTFIARAIAGELDAAFYPVAMDRVLSKWFGETERFISQLFDEASQHPRSIIFFDEAEALFQKRSDASQSVMNRVVPQLLQLINGIDPQKNCMFLLGATNQPWMLDPGATRPGRFGRLVYVGPPDSIAREAMLRHAMEGVPIDDVDFKQLAEQTEGYSGADLVADRDGLCSIAKQAAIQRKVAQVENGNVSPIVTEWVTMADFNKALTCVKPSISKEDTDHYLQFEKKLKFQ